MAFAVPVGQYIPGTSVVHTLDTRIKLLLLVAYIVAVFASSGWIGLGICAIILIASYLIAKIPFGLAFRGLKPVLYILTFTVVINAITFAAGDAGNNEHTLTLIGSFGLSWEGFVRGVYFALRIVFLTAMASLLTYSSSLLSLTDATSSILKPLKRFKLPVEDISIVFSITLRFIPLTVEEAEKIMTAQKSRGAQFDTGTVISRAKAWIPVIIPLFVNLFRHADNLATAMDARCYRSEGRTHLRSMKMHASDVIVGVVGTAALIALGIFG